MSYTKGVAFMRDLMRRYAASYGKSYERLKQQLDDLNKDPAANGPAIVALKKEIRDRFRQRIMPGGPPPEAVQELPSVEEYTKQYQEQHPEDKQIAAFYDFVMKRSDEVLRAFEQTFDQALDEAALDRIKQAFQTRLDEVIDPNVHRLNLLADTLDEYAKKVSWYMNARTQQYLQKNFPESVTTQGAEKSVLSETDQQIIDILNAVLQDDAKTLTLMANEYLTMMAQWSRNNIADVEDEVDEYRQAFGFAKTERAQQLIAAKWNKFKDSYLGADPVYTHEANVIIYQLWQAQRGSSNRLAQQLTGYIQNHLTSVLTEFSTRKEDLQNRARRIYEGFMSELPPTIGAVQENEGQKADRERNVKYAESFQKISELVRDTLLTEALDALMNYDEEVRRLVREGKSRQELMQHFNDMSQALTDYEAALTQQLRTINQAVSNVTRIHMDQLSTVSEATDQNMGVFFEFTKGRIQDVIDRLDQELKPKEQTNV